MSFRCRAGIPRLTRLSSTLAPPRHNASRILENIEEYQRAVDARGVKLDKISQVSDLTVLKQQLDSAKDHRIVLATKRNTQARAGRATSEEAIQAAKVLKKELQSAEQNLKQLESDWQAALDSIPNTVEPKTLKVSGEFEELCRLNENKIGEPNSSLDHVKIMTGLNMLDIASASRACGSGFYYLVGAGALLEQALIRFAIDKAMNAGFKLVAPPCIVRQEFASACGFRPRDQNGETQVYGVKGGGGEAASALALAGTAEIPLAAQQAHSTLDVTSVVKHAGVSRSFRAEAGAGGVDTRGLYRVHEFTKVEMFMWSKPDENLSSSLLESLLKTQIDIVESLELPARVLRIGPSDLGNPAYAKYDIEAWMPGRGQFGEISSASNCLDFQARRLHTVDADGQFVHTLNGTACAIPRVIIALVENNYDHETNTIKLPKALHGYLGTDQLK